MRQKDYPCSFHAEIIPFTFGFIPFSISGFSDNNSFYLISITCQHATHDKNGRGLSAPFHGILASRHLPPLFALSSPLHSPEREEETGRGSAFSGKGSRSGGSPPLASDAMFYMQVFTNHRAGTIPRSGFERPSGPRVCKVYASPETCALRLSSSAPSRFFGRGGLSTVIAVFARMKRGRAGR